MYLATRNTTLTQFSMMTKANTLERELTFSTKNKKLYGDEGALQSS